MILVFEIEISNKAGDILEYRYSPNLSSEKKGKYVALKKGKNISIDFLEIPLQISKKSRAKNLEIFVTKKSLENLKQIFSKKRRDIHVVFLGSWFQNFSVLWGVYGYMIIS